MRRRIAVALAPSRSSRRARARSGSRRVPPLRGPTTRGTPSPRPPPRRPGSRRGPRRGETGASEPTGDCRGGTACRHPWLQPAARGPVGHPSRPRDGSPMRPIAGAVGSPLLPSRRPTPIATARTGTDQAMARFEAAPERGGYGRPGRGLRPRRRAGSRRRRPGDASSRRPRATPLDGTRRRRGDGGPDRGSERPRGLGLGRGARPHGR